MIMIFFLTFFRIFMSYVLSQVDIPGLITAKLLKVSMKHIEIITKARQKGNHLNF